MQFTLVHSFDPILHRPAQPVDPEELAGLAPIIEEMFPFMIKSGGMGLAAPQVGIEKRFFIAQHEQVRLICLNPEITWKDDTALIEMKEGCLSYPGVFCNVIRPAEIKVRYQTLSGAWKTPYFKGMLARVFTHETDHCNGITMVDRETTPKTETKDE